MAAAAAALAAWTEPQGDTLTDTQSICSAEDKQKLRAMAGSLAGFMTGYMAEDLGDDQVDRGQGQGQDGSEASLTTGPLPVAAYLAPRRVVRLDGRSSSPVTTSCNPAPLVVCVTHTPLLLLVLSPTLEVSDMNHPPADFMSRSYLRRGEDSHVELSQ